MLRRICRCHPHTADLLPGRLTSCCSEPRQIQRGRQAGSGGCAHIVSRKPHRSPKAKPGDAAEPEASSLWGRRRVGGTSALRGGALPVLKKFYLYEL